MDFLKDAPQNEYTILIIKLNAFIAVFEFKSVKWILENKNNIDTYKNKYERIMEILLFDLKKELKSNISNLHKVELLTRTINGITTNIKQEIKET